MDLPADVPSEILLLARSVAIVTIDMSQSITCYNDVAEELLGVPVAALGRSAREVLPDLADPLIECLASGEACTYARLATSRDALMVSVTPIQRDGQVIGAAALCHKAGESVLLQSAETWLNAVFESSFDGITITDRDGTIIRYNKAAERVNGTNGNELVGKNLRELVADGRVDKVLTFEVVRTKRTVSIIQRNRAGRRLLCTGSPVFDAQGEVAFVVTNERDLRELDTLRAELQDMPAVASRCAAPLADAERKDAEASGMVLRSPAMQRAVEMALRAAGTDSTVLLLGESGVGKGLVSKLIHRHSARRGGPFLCLDCTGIPETLIESELFGYEKGAFTGAKAEGKPGLLELAAHGTLFLDEVAELPLAAQAKLLRFLEEREIVRVGGTAARRVDARIVAAANKDLEPLVAAGTFRADLFYRLNTIPIRLPALRERPEDLAPLFGHFLKLFNDRYHRQKTLSPAAIDLLCQYDFPGNVRELAHLVERLVVLSEEDCIEPHALPAPITRLRGRADFLLTLQEGLPLKDLVERFECYLIEQAVRKYGSQRRAAEKLGIDHTTIGRKIKKRVLPQSGALVHPTEP
jgi:PAS domain S-box-containing protein/TyrR family helix-turn-helix protein